MFKVLVSKTFAVWSYEAVDAGATDDAGFEYQDNEFTADNREELVEELVRTVQDELGHVEASQFPLDGLNLNHGWLYSANMEENHRTGEKTEYSLHFKGLDSETNGMLINGLINAKLLRG